jgi:hypothetical protein
LPELERAEELSRVAGDLAAETEAAIAKADAVRLLGRASRRYDADELYMLAWNLLQQPDAPAALGAERYDAMLEHVRTSMRVRGALQFNVRAPAVEILRTRDRDAEEPADFAELEQQGLLRRLRERNPKRI